MGHSVIPPSSAAIWAPDNGCPGWVTMVRGLPKEERSEDAERGTAAHELAAKMISAGARANVGMPERSETVGTEAPNRIIYDDAIFDSAAMYAGYAIKLMLDRGILGGPNLGIESPVRAPSVHPESYGTPDFYLYAERANELIVVDFKNGRGPVEVYENWQLINYAIAIIDTLGLWDAVTAGLRIRFAIVQPNGFHPDGPIREWNVNAERLQAKFVQLRAGAARAFAGDPETRTGAHCRYCRAKLGCRAAISAGFVLYETVADTTPVEMSTRDMATALRLSLRAWGHLHSMNIALEEQLKARGRAGENIPGFRLEPGRGREVWAKSFDEVAKLGDMLRVDLRKHETITPRQARAAGIPDEIVAGYSRRESAEMKLKVDDGSRARKVFD